MARFRLTVLAERALSAIGAYTRVNWGVDQAVRYLSELDATFARLAEMPSLGRGRSDLRPRLLDFPCNRHLVFFRRDPGGDVEILRILHQAQDHERHL